MLRATLDRTDDEDVVVRAVELRPRPGNEDRAMGARMLRRLGFGDVVDEATRWLQHEGVRQMIGSDWSRPVARPGRRGQADEKYAGWAERYVDALARAPRSPIQLLLRENQDPTVTTAEQVRWFLNEARRRGLLTAAPRGKPGGELTDKARALLRAMRQEG